MSLELKVYRIVDILHVFPMEHAWTYIPIPDKKVPPVKPGGWGSIKVLATIGKTSWYTSLFPMKGKQYFIPIKKSVCKKEALYVGEKVKLSYVTI